MRRDRFGGGAALGPGDAGGLHGVQQIAGDEDPRIAAAPILIDGGSAAGGIERDMARGQNAGLGAEAAGEDDSVAGDMLALAVTFDLHRLHLAETMDGDKAARGQHRHAEPKPGQNIGRPARRDARALLDHRRRRDAAMAQGEQSGEGDELAADDDRPAERPDLLQIDELLQGAGGDDAPGPVAADEPRTARRFPYAEGEEDGFGFEAAFAVVGIEGTDPPLGLDGGDGGAAADFDPGRRGGEAAGIGGTAEEPVKLAEAKGGMTTMARHAAQRLLAVDQHNVVDAELDKPLRCRKSRGAAPQDRDLIAHASAPLGNPARRPSASAATLALQ